MWFGTTAGLSEWNSVKFKNYYKFDGLPSTFITSICENKNNEIYVGTSKGLVIKSKDKFTTPPNLPEELNYIIKNLFVDSQNKLFILTESRGLWVKDKNVFSKMENKNSEVQIVPTSIVELKNGKVLVGTKGNGIYQVVGNKLERVIYHKIYKKYPVVDIVELNSDTLYVALKGLGVLVKNILEKSKKGNTFITTKHGLPSKFVTDLSLDNMGNLYVSTLNGVAIVKGSEVIKTITASSGLENEFVVKTFVLDSKTIFILTEGSGVFVYHPKSFTTYNTKSGLLHNNIWAVKELHGGKVCFLTDEGISFLDNNKFSSITIKNGLGDNLVISLYESDSNDLYVGTYVDGVNLISNGKIKRLNKNVGMPQNAVWSILEGYNGNILFVTHLEGIAVYDGKRIIDTLGIKNGLPSNKIVSSFKKRDGTILVGVENEGIFKLDKNKFLPYGKGMEGCLVWAMHEDEEGTLYFGTNEVGIIRLTSDNKCDTISVKNGLSNNSIIGIVHDNMGNIYASSDKGLNVIRFLKDGSYRIKQIYKKSGLANSECNQNAIYKDANGNIWVGTIGGVTRINSKIVDDSKVLVPVYISKLKVMDKEYEFTDSSKNIILDYNKNDITFDFAGINYSSFGLNNYKYKLSGIDENWIFDNSDEVRYANLPSGNYKFSVSASNNWGIWSEPTEMFFVIEKPYWETWWFLTTLFLIIVAIIAFVINYRLQNIIRLERLRSKISADLHDEIGSGLSEISILSELLKLNKVFDQKLVDGLDQIGDSTRTLIERLSDIIWIVNPRKETLKDLIYRIQDSYQEVFYQADISFSLSQIEILNDIVLPLEIRQNLYLIIKEAINNSLKYSKCKSITLNISKINQKLFVEISDNGIGIKKIDYDKGNGLFNMNKRAEMMKGTLQVESDSAGTKIKIEIAIKGKKKNG